MLLREIRVGEGRVWSHLNRGTIESPRRRGSVPHFGVDKGVLGAGVGEASVLVSMRRGSSGLGGGGQSPEKVEKKRSVYLSCGVSAQQWGRAAGHTEEGKCDQVASEGAEK